MENEIQSYKKTLKIVFAYVYTWEQEEDIERHGEDSM